MTVTATPNSVTQRGSLAKIKDTLTYFPHQIEGVRWLARRASAILADDMGLGKSLQALTVAAIGFENQVLNRVLVVAPTGLKYNWVDEIKDHTYFTYTVLDGTPKKRKKVLEEFNSDILIVHYEQVVKHWADFNRMGFGMVIYDEAHMIAGHKSDRTQACHKLNAPRHYLLTGSPLLNQIDGAWSLLHRVDPHRFPSYWRFVNRYAVYGGYKDKAIVGVMNEAEIRALIQERQLRRLKTEVLDLPGKQEIVIKVDMSPLQRQLYEQMKEELQTEAPDLDDGMLIAKNAMSKVMRLKQICGSTALVPGQPDESPKLDRAAAIALETIQNGEPIVIFTQFRPVLALMVERLEALGIPTVQLHGDINKNERPGIVRAWSDRAANGEPGALVCMFQVAGVGLNMTAASRVIRLDKLYVPKLNDQAVDRLDRIGQKRVVQIYDLFMRNSCDTRIDKILKMKKDLFDAVVETDNSDWKKMLIAAVLADEDDD